MKAEQAVSTDPAHNAMVQRVGRRIAEAAGDDIPDADWEFVVFDDSTQINAFAMSGGKVGVFTGLLELVDSDDELATVMGHEVAHVAARHSNERMSQQILVAGGGIALGVGTSGTEMSSAERAALLAAYGIGAGIGSLAYSRSHETEADEIGQIYAAKAGYDPRAAVTFWKKMAAAGSGNKPPAFLSTHPSDEKRIERLEKNMPFALLEYGRAKERYGIE